MAIRPGSTGVRKRIAKAVSSGRCWFQSGRIGKDWNPHFEVPLWSTEVVETIRETSARICEAFLLQTRILQVRSRMFEMTRQMGQGGFDDRRGRLCDVGCSVSGLDGNGGPCGLWGASGRLCVDAAAAAIGREGRGTGGRRKRSACVTERVRPAKAGMNSGCKSHRGKSPGPVA